MADNEAQELEALRELKWREVMSRVDAYRFYIKLCLEASAFFFATTGVILGFYLNEPSAPPQIVSPFQIVLPSQVATPPNYYLKFFLLLPILMGTVLGCICIYATKLQKEGSRIIEEIRVDLARKHLVTEEVPDVHLLDKLLLIFGFIFILVALLLIFVPLLKESPFLIYFGRFTVIAGFILVGGAISTFLAMRKDEQQESGPRQATGKSNGAHTAAIISACIFIISTAILLGGDGVVVRPAFDIPPLIAVGTAIVSAVGTVLATFFAWRNDRRAAREHELIIAQLRQELEAANEKPGLDTSEKRK